MSKTKRSITLPNNIFNPIKYVVCFVYIVELSKSRRETANILKLTCN